MLRALVDLTISGLIYLIPLAILVTAVLAMQQRMRARDARQHLRDTGVRGTGRVISSRRDHWAWESEQEGVFKTDRRRAGHVHQIELEVHLPGRAPFVTTLAASVQYVHLPAITPGAFVTVVADPANPANMLLDFRVLRDPSVRVPLPECRPAADPARICATGVHGQARVLSVGSGISHRADTDGTYEAMLVLEVQAPDRPPYLAHMLQRIHTRHLAQVQAGCIVHTRIDPTDPQQVVVLPQG